MGLVNDILEDSLPGVVVGAVAAAIVMPLLGGARASAGTASQGRGRPLLKAMVRSYISVSDRIKEATAEAREQLSDLAAEVRNERQMQTETAQDEAATGAMARG